MAALKSNQSEILKNVYDKMIVEAQNLSADLLDKISKAAERPKTGGAQFVIALNDYGNESAKAINEDDDFGTTTSEHYINPVVNAKITVAPFSMSGLARAVSEGDDMAFAQVAAQEMKRSKDRLRATENRMLFGYGTGLLATQVGAVSGQTITVDSVQYLRVNMIIDICTAGSATETASSVKISAINPSTKVVTLVGTISSALDTNEFVLENTRASQPSDGKEMMGLRGICDNGTDVATFEGISVSGKPVWQATRTDASSASLTEDMLQQLIDDVAIRSGEDVDTLVTHRKQRRKALDIATPQKRYNDGSLALGHKDISFNGLSLFLDKDAQPDTIYAFPLKQLLMFEIEPIKLGREDGSDVFLRTTNTDTFQAYWRHYANFGVRKRNCFGKLVSLAVPTSGVLA